MKKYTISDALKSLAPDAQWVVLDSDYSKIKWMSDDILQPSEQEVAIELQRLQNEYDSLEYQRKRAAEYPDFREYLDGIVKNDQNQIDAYIAACLAVKEKYPKPNPES